MKIAIIGYGKMGKAIDQMAQAKGHEVILKVDSQNRHTIDNLQDINPDVAIEFSTPSAAVSNLEKIIKQKIPVVCGTTAWHNQYDRICKLTRENNSALLYSSNYSIGMNLMFRLNEQMAKMMAKFHNYEPSIEELHHIHKKDAPSGTAVSLAEQIIRRRSDKDQWSLVSEKSNAIHINAIREGEIIGTHHVSYKSEIDDITLSHEAHNRDGFVAGAILAAEFIKGKKGIFTMQDVLSWALK